MTSSLSNLFNDKDLVKKYEQITVTAKVAEDALEIYLSTGGSLEGKTILDNACGTGVVTKAILGRTNDVRIEAADISEAMIAAIKPIAENAHPARVHAHVMDAHSLSFPDDTFDLSFTMFGIFFFSDPVKAMNELYRTTKPGGTCIITIWSKVGHRPAAEEMVKRVRGENGEFDKPLRIGSKEMEDPALFIKFFERAGFKNCRHEPRPSPFVWAGNDAVENGSEMLGKFYRNFITFKDADEEARYDEAWKEEMRARVVDGKLTFPMEASIAFGEK